MRFGRGSSRFPSSTPSDVLGRKASSTRFAGPTSTSWLLKRWDEYFAAVATAIFLPYEIYDIVDKVTAIRVGTFIINVAAVVYLLRTKRLFGIRRGCVACEA